MVCERSLLGPAVRVLQAGEAGRRHLTQAALEWAPRQLGLCFAVWRKVFVAKGAHRAGRLKVAPAAAASKY